MQKEEIIKILKDEIVRETGLPLTEIPDAADFFSLGLDSISSIYVLDRLEKKIKLELNPIYFWDYPTIELLSTYLAGLKNEK